MISIAKSDLTVPNTLTCIRIIMAIAAGFFFVQHRHEAIAASLCISASLLDYFDGWYARKFHQTTRLGAHLDPFADKVLICVMFITLSYTLRWRWFSLFVCIILVREVIITGYRIYIRRRSGKFIPASMLGKIKTLIQCIVGGLLLFYIFVYPEKMPTNVGLIFVLMVFTSFVTIDSGLRYLLPTCADGKRRSALERLYQFVLGIRAREV
ncbi:MAG: CDP-diacylglycerol--glycerol-3-phosphate 3-phosphatidyltransferase [bacterium]|nr:MAG: CDP-diacylglycerol--glycerol-3-phosphate 3-phosphatidyltransferase [bacterium]